MQMSMISTSIQQRLALPFQYWIYPPGGTNNRKCNQSTPISPMHHATAFLLYHMLLDGRPVLSLCKILLSGASQKPQAGLFAKN